MSTKQSLQVAEPKRGLHSERARRRPHPRESPPNPKRRPPRPGGAVGPLLSACLIARGRRRFAGVSIMCLTSAPQSRVTIKSAERRRRAQSAERRAQSAERRAQSAERRAQSAERHIYGRLRAAGSPCGRPPLRRPGRPRPSRNRRPRLLRTASLPSPLLAGALSAGLMPGGARAQTTREVPRHGPPG